MFLFQSIAGFRLLHLQLVLCHELKVELVEVGEPAVPAPDREMPAADHDIVRAGHMAVPALRSAFQFPHVIAPDLCVRARLAYILDTGDKDPCCTAVVARDLSLVRHGFDDLVCHLLAVVTVGAVGQKDKPVAHVWYLHARDNEFVAQEMGPLSYPFQCSYCRTLVIPG